jgi:hypothetical protein
MSEQTYRAPNYYDREIDLSAPAQGGPVGVPAGVIGTSNRGPAFIPITVANFQEFAEVFGELDSRKFGPYAANEFLKHRSALTYLRVLGAGTVESESDILSYQSNGRVKNAGFKLNGVDAPDDSLARHNGVVQFLTAKHQVQSNEAYGFPMFTDNNSLSGSIVNLVRGLIMTPTGSRVLVLDGDQVVPGAITSALPNDDATVVSGKFKLIISSTLGNGFWNQDGQIGVKIYTASFDPSSDDYYAKILNTDPERFVDEQHLLYADFPVDAELATATYVGVVSGSTNTTLTGGETTTPYRQLFGAYDTRYTTPKTSWFISQPFGDTEYDLFYFETIDDGAYANSQYKVSISNLQKSSDDSNLFGTFNVEIRNWSDNDVNAEIIEFFPNCNLDPNSQNYVARKIGDRKVNYNFDATEDNERRIVTSGRYENVSKYVRIRTSDQLERSLIPQNCLPFGFRGASLLKTTDSLKDFGITSENARLSGFLTGQGLSLSGSVVPPVPFRFKVTRGQRISGSNFIGEPSPTELATPLFYWGVRFERVTDVLNPNIISEKNALLENYTKFTGIEKLDVLVTGSGADTFHHNKFTLSKVALPATSVAELTGSVNDHMKEAAYIRNANPDKSKYTINDPGFGNRITFATLLNDGSAAEFNRFSPYMKFTNFFQGGYDGLNLLDRDARKMNDKSTSFDAGGGAEANYISPGLGSNMNGAGQDNSTVSSFKTAIRLMTDPMTVTHNVLAVPGIKDSFLTDFAATRCREYGLGFYVMDIPAYNDVGERLYDDSTDRPSVRKTASIFTSRVIDNNYSAPYWPRVVIDDTSNSRRVTVPASVAAMGAIAFNDKMRYQSPTCAFFMFLVRKRA